MKRLMLVAFSLVFVAAAGFSQTPSEPLFNVAAILNPFVVTGSCAMRESEVRFAAVGEKAECTASCGTYGSMSCPAGTTTCSAVNRDCPQRGYVTCNGVTTYCPSCTTQDHCYECTASGGLDCFSCCLCEGDSTVKECRLRCSG